MIPDKIYIPQNISRSDVTSLSFTDDKGRGIEFIRKEALLEWLNERINNGDEEGLMTNQIANLAYKDVIDKLNSL